ncbi:membrane protein involved in colicin uptake [Paraburkholderia youngii]
MLPRVRGVTALARESDIAREALCRAPSSTGNAEFATIMKMIAAMGLRLTLAKPDAAVKATARGKTATKAAPAKKAAAKKAAAKKAAAPAKKAVAKKAAPAPAAPAVSSGAPVTGH